MLENFKVKINRFSPQMMHNSTSNQEDYQYKSTMHRSSLKLAIFIIVNICIEIQLV